MEYDRSCPRQENDNVHEIHCISPCRSLIRTEYITRFIHHPFRREQTFLVTQVECPSHFKTLKSVIFGTVSHYFIHILFKKSTQSFLEKTSIGCREHIQDYERSGHDAVVGDLALHNSMVGGTIFRMRI